ncbi:MAG: radical SAM protein [Phycisphaerales bacterium]|nr:MAG: radical SAM protein [Phycisphaerales bacterium]
MSSILFLQLMRRRRPGDTGPVFDQQLGQLSAILKKDGHQTALVRLDGFDPSRLHHSVEQKDPELAYAVFDGASVDAARRTFGEIQERFGFPVVVGGSYATVMPDTALSMPGVCAVVLGDADYSFPAYLKRRLGSDADLALEGVWTNENGQVNKQGIPTINLDLDTLPFADRELFGVDADSEILDITVGRGCPTGCAYCINDRLREAADAGQQFVRRRSPQSICDEIDQLCLEYPNTRFLRFTDHALATDLHWLEAFAEAYEFRCGLPFECHVRANVFDERRGDLLKKAGCTVAEIDVISGSDFIRNEILEMDTSDEQIEHTFALLKARGICTKSVNLVGAPYSSQVAEDRTVDINRRVAADVVDIRVYYPFYGTKARTLTKEEGWLTNRCESSFSTGESVLDMPRLDAERIRRISSRMPQEIAGGRPSAFRRAWIALRRVPAAVLANFKLASRGDSSRPRAS